MSFKNLVESECGQRNPLVSLTHHITKDKAYKETAFANVSQLKDGYVTDLPLSAEVLADEFLQETKQAALYNPQSFRMDQLLQEMQEIERVPPIVSPRVVDIASESHAWCQEFVDENPAIMKGRADKTWEENANEEWSRLVSKNDYGATEHKADLSSVVTHEDAELAKTANEILGTVEDPKFLNTEFMNYVRTLAGNEDQSNSVLASDWQSEFLSSTRNSWGAERWAPDVHVTPEAWGAEFLKSVTNNQDLGHESKSETWAKEFVQAQKSGTFKDVTVDSEAMTATEKEEFWKKLQNDWDEIASGEAGATSHPWLSDFEEDYGEPFKEYSFQKENALKDHPNPLAEGKKCLEQGDIPSAVLYFEAAVQQDEDNSEAWLLLGTTHAANEQDPSAVPALKRGLDLDPSNLKGWMSLASSYTNESYQNMACRSLQNWIRNNPEYGHLIKKESNSGQNIIVSSLAPKELLDEIQDLYLRAANSRSGRIDPDVQCGLGVLFNLTGDYDKAVDCFQAALHVNPSDSQLWNKLGATFANSNRSVEAIDAYRHALEISPGFIRCRYNLGISCINLGAHKEAVEHFLESLNMQQKSIGQAGASGPSLVVSDNIWSTLRVCLRSLNARHLLPLVDNRDLVALNEEFGTSRDE